MHTLNSFFLTVLLLTLFQCSSTIISTEGLTIANSTNILETNGGWWEVEKTSDSVFDAFKDANIFLRTTDLDESKIHSCYEYKVLNQKSEITSTDTFCYPSIVVTGHRKCSTSALYHLLTQYPNAVHNQINVKENCAFIGDRSIIQYFDSLPRNVEAGEIIIDGCIDLKGNIKMRKLLRQPNAFYLVRVIGIFNVLIVL